MNMYYEVRRDATYYGRQAPIYCTTQHHSQQDHVMVKQVFVTLHVNVNEGNVTIASNVLHDTVHRLHQGIPYFQMSYSFTVHTQMQFHNTHTKSMAFPVPIFMKLMYA
jgi:hypothetical protein